MVLVEMYVDLKLKDIIVDHLFEHGYEDFYFFECFKYATSSLLTSEKEQVSGRKDYGLFKIFLEEQEASILLEQVQSLFKKEVTFYLLPLTSIPESVP
ncbi:DUF3240 family protein [Helicobacter suis]|uniref:DUF3240 family protein n=1 Tax=Helicobacter suis TaxID=104628 RepID=UPI0013D0BBA7|nr:DUF3240 family protein [Helicobacter suis]